MQCCQFRILNLFSLPSHLLSWECREGNVCWRPVRKGFTHLLRGVKRWCPNETNPNWYLKEEELSFYLQGRHLLRHCIKKANLCWVYGQGLGPWLILMFQKAQGPRFWKPWPGLVPRLLGSSAYLRMAPVFGPIQVSRGFLVWYLVFTLLELPCRWPCNLPCSSPRSAHQTRPLPSNPSPPLRKLAEAWLALFISPPGLFPSLSPRWSRRKKNQKKTKAGNSPMNPRNSTGSISGENASESWPPKQGGWASHLQGWGWVGCMGDSHSCSSGPKLDVAPGEPLASLTPCPLLTPS